MCLGSSGRCNSTVHHTGFGFRPFPECLRCWLRHPNLSCPRWHYRPGRDFRPQPRTSSRRHPLTLLYFRPRRLFALACRRRLGHPARCRLQPLRWPFHHCLLNYRSRSQARLTCWPRYRSTNWGWIFHIQRRQEIRLLPSQSVPCLSALVASAKSIGPKRPKVQPSKPKGVAVEEEVVAGAVLPITVHCLSRAARAQPCVSVTIERTRCLDVRNQQDPSLRSGRPSSVLCVATRPRRHAFSRCKRRCWGRIQGCDNWCPRKRWRDCHPSWHGRFGRCLDGLHSDARSHLRSIGLGYRRWYRH